MDTKAKGYLRSAVSAIPEKSSSQALQFGEHLNETHDSLKPEEGRGSQVNDRAAWQYSLTLGCA